MNTVRERNTLSSRRANDSNHHDCNVNRTLVVLSASLLMSVLDGCGSSSIVSAAANPPVGTGRQGQFINSALAPSYVATVKADRPLVYYRLNESSGTTALDSSGNAHNGRYTSAGVTLNGPALLTLDPTAKSASFPSGYLSESTTWGDQAVTAECWIKPTASDLASSSRIVGNGWTDNTGNGFMLWLTNGTAGFNTGWLGLAGTSALTAGHVYYLAGTYDNTTGATLYVNGLAVANKLPGALPNPQRGDSATTYIGVLDATAGGFGFTDYFKGDISDCAIYGRTLTPARIAAHYDAGVQASVTPAPIPSVAPHPSAPPPTSAPSPIAYNAGTACINRKLFTNNVLPTNEGEFATSGLDRTWWGRMRGNPLGGNQYSGFQVSWGRNQYDTYFGDLNDGISAPSDDPFYVGADTAAPGSPRGVRISAVKMPAHLVGNPQVHGATWYSGVLDTPIDQQYGFFVARLRLPAPAPGMSPAFWMLTNNGTRKGSHGPLNGEWDTQEMFGNDYGNGMNAGTILWNSGSIVPQNWGGTYAWPTGERATPSQNYHDYGVLLNSGGAAISSNDYGPGGPGYVYGAAAQGATNYLDGVPLYGHTGGADVTSGVAWKELMAMFQVAPQNSWLGKPNPANFPAAYWVQWIRVYRPTTTSC